MSFEVGDIVTIKNNNFTTYTFFFISEKDLIRRSYILYPIEKIIGPDTNYRCEVADAINRLNLVRTAESVNYEDITTNKTVREILLETMEMAEKYTRLPPLYKERNFVCTYNSQLEEMSKQAELANSFTKLNLSAKETEKSFKKLKESLNSMKEDFNKIKEEQKMYKILELYENKQKQLIRNDYYSKMKEIKENDVVSIIIEEMKKQLESVIPEKMEKTDINFDVYSDETDKLLEDLEKEKDKKLDELYQKLEEIKALLQLSPDYQESLKILRDYEIIDKKKNILL